MNKLYILLTVGLLVTGCASSYKKLGVTKNDKEVTAWEKTNVTVKEALAFKRLGVSTPKEAEKYKNEGIKPTQWSPSANKYLSIKTIHDVLRSNSAGYKPKEAILWNKNGVRTPQEANRWKKLTISSSKVKVIKKMGYITPEDAKDIKNIHITWSEVVKDQRGRTKAYKNGIYDPLIAKGWKDLGYNIYYGDKNIIKNLTIKEAREWSSYGIKFHEIQLWKNEKIFNPEEARGWKESGINIRKKEDRNILAGGLTIEEVKNWKSNGVNARSILFWKQVNVSSKEAKQWKEAGFRYTDQVKGWKEFGLSPLEAKRAKEKGYRFDKAIPQHYIQANITNYKEYMEWNEVKGYCDTDCLKFFKIKKQKPTDIENWMKKANIDNIREVYSWNLLGVNKPEEVLRWKNVGIYSSKYKILKSVNIKTVAEYRPYKGLRMDIIKALKKLKVKPTQLVKDMQGTPGLVPSFIVEFNGNIKKDFLSNLKKLKKNGCKRIERTYFHSTDPYNNKGKCYMFEGDLFQRMDKYNGLASFNNNVFYVNFKNSWRENTSVYGIIKGSGKYNYSTLYGQNKTVSKGKVLIRSW